MIFALLLACTELEYDSTAECPEDTGYAPAEQPDDQLLPDRPPVIVSTVPQAGDLAVNPGLTEIRATFSKDMSHNGWSYVITWADHFPEVVGDPVWEDPRTVVLTVSLAADTGYSLGFNNQSYENFRDTSGNVAVPYELSFHTAPQ
ncbi:MAG: Ig-like domain-containing protein [Myxococcota bacterium]|nr:Ig-like domain-containing protein [Myxococcota bacterium]